MYNLLLVISSIISSLNPIAPIENIAQTIINNKVDTRAPISTTTTQTTTTTANEEKDNDLTSLAETLTNKQNYEELPLERIGFYPVTSSKKIAILIPQSHKYPGSNDSDALNDSAVTVQKNIYAILKNITTKFGINNIMAEGDLLGPVPNDKINEIKQDIFNQQKYSSSSPYYASLNRKLWLYGAPYLLKAEGEDVNLEGAERKTTLDESADVVRDYIYVQDRINQLSRPAVKTNQQLLQQTNKTNNNNYSDVEIYISRINQLNISTERKNRLINIIKQMAGVSKEQGNSVVLTNPDKKLPAREDNPYKSINDLGALNNILKKSQEKINEVVLNKRNKEVAEEFENMLMNKNSPAGVLQFGSQHENGLVDELNKNGLSVIVLRPQGIKN